MPPRHVEGPREERVVHDAVHRAGRALVLGDHARQSPRAGRLERAEVDVGSLRLREAALVEAVGDRLDGDGGGVDGFHGVGGGGDGGLDAFGGQTFGEL